MTMTTDMTQINQSINKLTLCLDNHKKKKSV